MQDLLQQQQPSAASPRWLALKFPSELWQLNGATWVPGGPAYTPAEVSAETCDISRPVLNARAAGRQELPCSASTLPPMHFPAQPKPRLVLHETMQSRASRPSLPHSTAEVHASRTLPIISLPKAYFPSILMIGALCVKTRAEQEPELGIFGAAGGHTTRLVRRSSRSTRPKRTPRAFARLLPSPVRAGISSRSNSAIPASMVTSRRPCGVVVNQRI